MAVSSPGVVSERRGSGAAGTGRLDNGMGKASNEEEVGTGRRYEEAWDESREVNPGWVEENGVREGMIETSPPTARSPYIISPSPSVDLRDVEA